MPFTTKPVTLIRVECRKKWAMKEQQNKIKIGDYKRAKIVATIGPSSFEQTIIEQMVRAGVNGFRLNFSHGTNDERLVQIPAIREAAKAYGKPVAIIQDLQGPKIRLGDFDGFIPVQKGQVVRFMYKCEYVENGPIPTQYDLAKKVQRGERIYLFDGRIRTIVQSVKDGIVYAEVMNDGVLTQRKGINLPDTDMAGDILTKKDKADVAFGATQDIDYVALSFVQRGSDVELLRKLLKNHNSSAKIIAKIETRAALDNIDEIVAVSDAVMVARGDLAIEAEPEVVPIAQRAIIASCLAQKKISIVATQMLGSMVDQPEPSRAEVSDVATSVILGADAVMLSDETASGKYPVESVQMMKRIITYAEKHSPVQRVVYDRPTYTEQSTSVQNAVAHAVVALGEQVGADAIVAETKTGSTALSIAALRPHIPILAVTSQQRTAQQLAIMYGSKTYVRQDEQYQATKLTEWLLKHDVLERGNTIVTASGKYPGVAGTTDTIKVRILE